MDYAHIWLQVYLANFHATTDHSQASQRANEAVDTVKKL